MSLEEAIKMVKAAGYRVTKPAEKKHRTVGPTFEARWSDGIITRMSIYTTDENLDVGRAVRVSAAAYDSRTKGLGLARLESGHFDRAGQIIKTYEGKQLRGYL